MTLFGSSAVLDVVHIMVTGTSRSGLFIVRPDETVPGAARDGGASSQQRILIVEDDAAISSAISETLREEGFEVVTAANGSEALQLLRTTPPPSAILLDLMMPTMDGWDFRNEQLRDRALKDIPVIVVTAAGFSLETIRTQFGDVALIRKPVAYLDLLDALERVRAPKSSAA